MHLGQLLPQSVSVSVPFFTKSVQLSVWQTDDVHTLLLQSDVTLQLLPLPQGEHPPPPQSTADSVPFCTPSEHVAVWHLLPVQRALAQSALVVQAPPAAHFGQLGPPQSSSDSVPSFV
jgi:hypothetical protein